MTAMTTTNTVAMTRAPIVDESMLLLECALTGGTATVRLRACLATLIASEVRRADAAA
jgi:hypothetical protein